MAKLDSCAKAYRDLYASVGFRVLKEFPRYRKPLTAEFAGGNPQYPPPWPGVKS